MKNIKIGSLNNSDDVKEQFKTPKGLDTRIWEYHIYKAMDEIQEIFIF